MKNFYCVSPQEDLPLYKGQEINSESCSRLINFIELYKSKAGTAAPSELLKEIILASPSIISDIRVLVGISDKRLYLDLTYLAHIFSDQNGKRLVSESREHLLKHDTKFFIKQLSESHMKTTLAEQIVDYFLSHDLLPFLDTFASLKKQQSIPIFNHLIAPKELQQMQAKYRGHGAEQTFAQVVKACGLDIIPQNKDIDPMAGHDPNVDLSSMTVITRNTSNENCYSFDLVITQDREIRVLIQSLIHSSDPRQYGVNKSDETLAILKRLLAYNRSSGQKPVYLLGSVDGVGFCENPNGTIVKMLDAFDDLFQIHTLFKLPLFLQKIGMIDIVLGISFDTQYFDAAARKHFQKTYLQPLHVADMTGQDYSGFQTFQAGKATVILKP